MSRSARGADVSAEAFAGVFDQHQFVLLGELLQFGHAAGMAEDFHRRQSPWSCGVMAAATLSTSMFSVLGSMSTKTGLAPTYRMQLADATNENGVVMTSCASPTPAAIMAQCSPAVPEETPIAMPPPGELGARRLEFFDLRADRKRGGVQHIDDGVDFALGNVRLSKGNVIRPWILGNCESRTVS